MYYAEYAEYEANQNAEHVREPSDISQVPDQLESSP
jgi:hypothetical protein